MRLTWKLFGSFVLAAIAGVALTLNAAFVNWFHSARLAAVLIVLILLHFLRYPRLLFSREFAMYAMFLGYMLIALLWTPNVELSLNTLVPAIDFILILILFGALVTYHDLRTILVGTLVGFLVGALAYDLSSGFPLVFPDALSYNSIASLFLFGIFITLMLSWNIRATMLPIWLGLVLWFHLIATTSIKTNLGLLLGIAAAGLIHYKTVLRVIRRQAIWILVFVGMAAYAVATSDKLVEAIQRGVERVSLGVEILTAGSNLYGYTGFWHRAEWAIEGLGLWTQNPLFGYGVEAFRDRFGITSHSTVVDLLYNSGLIGFFLFYGIFASLVWRLFRSGRRNPDNLHALIFGALICYFFITLSGIMQYNSFLAVFIGIATAMLVRKPVYAETVKEAV